MAECHPVGFRWVMKAKERGATIIHVDPRFTRTSAVADIHVPIRAGSDIAFLGGIIHYILENERYFREYVVNYTNAAAILNDDFEDTEDHDGLFGGWDPEKGEYEITNVDVRGRGTRGRGGRARSCVRIRQGAEEADSGRSTPTRRCSIRAACFRC